MIYLYIYITGLLVAGLLCRIRSVNDFLHNGKFGMANPVPVFMISWPIYAYVLSIVGTIKLIMASFNWIGGNGFITKTQKVTGSTMGCNQRIYDIRRSRSLK